MLSYHAMVCLRMSVVNTDAQLYILSLLVAGRVRIVKFEVREEKRRDERLVTLARKITRMKKSKDSRLFIRG